MNPEVLFAQSVELLAAGRAAEAAQGFRRLLVAYPGHRPSLNNLGAALLMAGDAKAALASFREVEKIAPGEALSHYNLGRCLRECGDESGAESAYRRAIELRPDYAEAIENLANLLADRNRHDEALPLYERLIGLRPQSASGYRQLASLLRDLGRLAEARAALATGIARCDGSGGDGLKILQCLLVSPLPQSAAEIAAQRAALAAEIETLLDQPLQVTDPLREIGSVPFFLAYHGEDDRPLNTALARLFRHACPQLGAVAPAPAGHGGKRRIGVVTAYAGQHTTARFFDASLGALGEVAELHYFYAGREWQDQLAAAGQVPPARHRQLPDKLPAAQQMIAAAGLDLLIYPEVGIHPLPYFLAHARLAPVQIALYGQPLTTGIPTVDYFLSHAGSEPADAAEHYSERLLLLPREVTYACLAERVVTPAARARTDFGLPASGPLYLCAQSLFKLHPDFDATLRALLEADPASHLVLIATRGYWGDAMLRRLSVSLGDAVQRVIMLPYLGLADFLGLVQCCEVALDTHQFSGGGTTFDTLQVGTPVVTLRGRVMRARQTAALYERMGIDELTVDTVADYVALAHAIAHDPARRERLKAEILARKRCIFDDRGSARAFVDLVLGVAGGQAG